jgi:hypothetical protein
MKIYGYIFILLISSVLGYAQVGIGTVNPLADLHIAGENATIRIESLDAVNNTTYNDGIKLSKAYVDGNGDITIGNGSGASGTSPLNFLIDVPNFVVDNPYNITDVTWFQDTGSVVNNNDLGETTAADEITTLTINVPQDATIEIKYGITMLIIGSDITAGPPYYFVDLDQAVSMLTYIKVDLNSDGLVGDELTKVYGRTAQYYTTNNQGIVGYPYMNGQAYLSVPAGNHTMYFYGQVKDAADSFTSVGFGGAQDYLKIRVYN